MPTQNFGKPFFSGKKLKMKITLSMTTIYNGEILENFWKIFFTRPPPPDRRPVLMYANVADAVFTFSGATYAFLENTSTTTNR